MTGDKIELLCAADWWDVVPSTLAVLFSTAQARNLEMTLPNPPCMICWGLSSQWVVLHRKAMPVIQGLLSSQKQHFLLLQRHFFNVRFVFLLTVIAISSKESVKRGVRVLLLSIVSLLPPIKFTPDSS